jgi:hypothetical protein
MRRRRVNTINGRTYSEDPTVMAWNLINEPRAYRMAPQLQVITLLTASKPDCTHTCCASGAALSSRRLYLPVLT